MRIGDNMSRKISSTNGKVPITSYIKLALIIVGTVIAVLLARNWYIRTVNYQLSIPVITETLLNEINADEVYNYVRENEDAIFYIGVVSDESCRNFEEDFNSVIRERNLEYTITYLNISKESNKSKFIKQFNKFYDIDIAGYPSLIVFKEGKVKDIISVETGKELNVKDVEKFLDKNKIVPFNYE